jgi:hypothetical protein
VRCSCCSPAPRSSVDPEGAAHERVRSCCGQRSRRRSLAVVGVVPTTAGMAPPRAAGDLRRRRRRRGSGGGVSGCAYPRNSRQRCDCARGTRPRSAGPTPLRSSGLLCAIDGFPKTGCGVRGSHYAYWAYFHGRAGAWSYQNVGPAGSRVHADVVEGWRWQPAVPKPGRSWRARQRDGPATCVPAPPITAAPPPTRPPVTVRQTGLPRDRRPAATAPQSTVVTEVPGRRGHDDLASVQGSTVRDPARRAAPGSVRARSSSRCRGGCRSRDRAVVRRSASSWAQS